MSILSLLQLALSLLLAAQGPNVPAATRQQALDFAKQTVVFATTQLQSMQNNQPEQTPSPAASSTNQPSEPTLGSSPFAPEPQAPQSPYTVEVTQSIPKTGGTLVFTVKKDGKPIEVIDKATSNLSHQQFIRLPEDLPPGRGIFHLYIPEQTEDIQNPSLDLVIEGTTVNVPISFTQ